MRKYLMFFTFLLLIACDEDKVVLLSGEEKETKIHYFDQDLFGIDSLHFDDEIQALEEKFPIFFINDASVDYWKSFYKNAEVRKIYGFSKAAIAGKKAAISDELSTALKYYQHYYPNYPIPEVYAWTSDFQSAEPNLITDSVAFIFLEHYLGAENEYYSKMPKYMGEVKSTDYLVPDFIAELSKRFVQKKMQDNSLVNEMIYQGKLLYFADALMPNTEDYRKIAYSPEKLEWCKANEGKVWSYFVNKELLFSVKKSDRQRFIEPAPFSKFYLPVDRESPGRIGAWIGWQIVRSYMENHPEVSLQELMEDKNSKQILNKSKYKPEI